MISKILKIRTAKCSSNFRVKEQLRSGELQVSGDLWPRFLYRGFMADTNDPWDGLFRSALLVTVSHAVISYLIRDSYHEACQAYKHIFTSPSSVEKEAKATRSGNARIHGMKEVTMASIAYVSTQVWLFSFKLKVLYYCLSEYRFGSLYVLLLSSRGMTRTPTRSVFITPS